MTKKIVSFLLLSLIALYAITSTGNIIRLVDTVHHGWVSWTLGTSLGFTLALSSFVAAMSKTRKLFVHALIVAGLSGIMSAIFQTYMYISDGAEWYIAALLGFGIPLIGEVGLALLDAAFTDEHQTLETAKVENETVSRMEQILTSTRAQTQQLAQENAQLRSQLTALSSQSQQTENEISHRHPTAESETQSQNPISKNEKPTETKRSAKALAKLQEVADAVANNSVSSYQELAETLGWANSTANRYWNMAIEDRLIAVEQGA